MSTVVVNPNFDAYYNAFYIRGIVDAFGETNVRFSARPFPAMPSECLAFIAKDQVETRVVIDPCDGAGIVSRVGLEWCDVYGKVNLAPSVIPKQDLRKCVAIGPSFGVQLWRGLNSWRVALQNYRLSVDYRTSCPGSNSSFQHFANYRRQSIYRTPLDAFTPASSKDDYIFFLSSVWKDNEAPETNDNRALFIEGCTSFANLTFEGGFVVGEANEQQRFNNRAISSHRIDFQEYLAKTKSSAVVFNTPAVWCCHGWKLGEFLALGKAIISTPLTRDLPSPLIHGQHIHYVEPTLSCIQAAIDRITGDRDYRKRLEENSRGYYSTFLQPNRVIDRLINFVRSRSQA
jgi:hypothetical protein